ncbi:MAG: pilus assembly protein, partial [Cellulomonas sp.]
RIQAATFAAEGAAREAGRTAATASVLEDATRRATMSVELALDEQGFDEVDPARALTLTCSTEPCLQPGSDIVTVVAFDVDLPFVPEFIRSVVPLHVPVVARHVASVDSFAGRP